MNKRLELTITKHHVVCLNKIETSTTALRCCQQYLHTPNPLQTIKLLFRNMLRKVAVKTCVIHFGFRKNAFQLVQCALVERNKNHFVIFVKFFLPTPQFCWFLSYPRSHRLCDCSCERLFKSSQRLQVVIPLICWRHFLGIKCRVLNASSQNGEGRIWLSASSSLSSPSISWAAPSNALSSRASSSRLISFFE